MFHEFYSKTNTKTEALEIKMPEIEYLLRIGLLMKHITNWQKICFIYKEDT